MSFDFRLHNVFTSTLDLDKNVMLASGHDDDNNNNNNNNNLLPSVFTRLHAVVVSLVTLITRLHLQSPHAFRDKLVIEGVCP